MMKSFYLFFFLCMFTTVSLAQNATIVQIEKLSKPEKLLALQPSKKLAELYGQSFEKTSNLPDSLVFYQDHPFLTGAFNAYKDHRPFVLSPDMIWLLISQGFARHVDYNHDELRDLLVKFKDKQVLTVFANDIKLGEPNRSNWEGLFPQFNQQISNYTSKEFVKNLTANFTTTTPTTQIASQITLMDGLKSYFKYQVMIVGCGIPRVTIEGSVADWENIQKKIQYIEKYKLAWWTDELQPVIKEIIQSKKGKANNEFWMNMIKVHTTKAYGTINTIDGWITKLFPYTKKGEKTNFKPISNIGDLAPELVKVPFVLKDSEADKTYNMEFWAGFIGLQQNKSDFTLKPEIGWAINNMKLKEVDRSNFSKSDALSVYNITEFPNEVYASTNLSILELSFKNEISVPDKLAEININILKLKGKIAAAEEKRILKLFPKTQIVINDKWLNVMKDSLGIDDIKIPTIKESW